MYVRKMGIINCFMFELALLIMYMFIKYYNKKRGYTILK